MSSCGSNAGPWARWRMSICSFAGRWSSRAASPLGTPAPPIGCIILCQIMATAIGGRLLGWGGYGTVWSLFYALHFMARDQLHLCMDRVELLRSAWGLSFANIFAVFGFYRRFPSDLLADPTFVTVLLTVSETLLGFVFLFFLGLGLRTRFRLR